jgi:hypothetical protein
MRLIPLAEANVTQEAPQEPCEACLMPLLSDENG